MRNVIIRYYFHLNPIFEIIEKNKIETVTFFIDLSSISRGIYSSNILVPEILINNKDVWFEETVKYIKWLENRFRKYEPFFILFFDKGVYSYHWDVYSEYKLDRYVDFGYVVKDKGFSVDLMRAVLFLKNYTYKKIFEELNSKENIVAVYLNDEECDIVPHFFIKENYLDTAAARNLNVILSSDKDLFQTTYLSNTIQIIITRNKGKYFSKIIDKNNAINFLCKKENDDFTIPSFYVPEFLSIGGDKSDNIPGIPRIGYKTFFNLIKKRKSEINLNPPNRIYPQIPKIIKNDENVKIIERNLKITDFNLILENKTVFGKLKRIIEKLI